MNPDGFAGPGRVIPAPPLGDGYLRPAGALAVLLSCLLLAGCYTMPPREDVAWIRYSPPPPVQAEATRSQRNLYVFDWVWSTVNTYYYDSTFHGVDWAGARERHRPAAEATPDDDQLYRTINAMLGELNDGHTQALSPRAVAEQRDRRWVWIGLEYALLQESPDRVVVTYVWPGGPAMEAGVRPGWILETCNGQGARVFLQAFLQDKRLEYGQRVMCAFLDEKDQLRLVELAARPVSRPRIQEVRVLANGCVYLRFDQFAYPEVKWLYEQLQAHGTAPALILDLRYNIGGDVVYLEYIAGLLSPRGQELGVVFKHGMDAETVNSRRPLLVPRYWGRLAILVSHDSASAAEIFANAMRHYHHGVIVGQKTAGHVLNAYQGDLPDGGKLSFSIRDFRTPDGRRLEGEGVVPDVAIAYYLDDIRTGKDPGIEAALMALRRSPLKINP